MVSGHRRGIPEAGLGGQGGAARLSSAWMPAAWHRSEPLSPRQARLRTLQLNCLQLPLIRRVENLCS